MKQLPAIFPLPLSYHQGLRLVRELCKLRVDCHVIYPQKNI